MKKIICKILGHKYQYNFGWMPNKSHCTRCGKRWKTEINPFYTGNPIEDDMHIWVEDKQKEDGKEDIS
jgi:hypothetical protein